MARSTPTTQVVGRDGATTSMTAPSSDGDIIDGGAVWLTISNGGGAPITVTAQTPGTVAGLAIADSSITIAAGATKDYGPFPGVFVQPADAVTGPGKVLIDYSAITSVTRAVKKLGS